MNEYEYYPHDFIRWKPFAQPVCTGCGLLATNNDFTRWACRVGCDWKLHPQFRQMKKKYTGHNAP